MEAASALGRKERGAFFTPPAIADFLASWALAGKVDAKVLDPTCGEAVFLLAAAERLKGLGAAGALEKQLYGVDLHADSLIDSQAFLKQKAARAHLLKSDFAAVPPPSAGSPLPLMDAVIGNPPFVRFQEQRADLRMSAAQASLAQGVRLSGLASSWAALLVHSSAFLKEDGRLAMVLPAELLTVHYAEPIRRWLRQRFAAVRLVLFERLQFHDAEEQVVLLAAEGSGGCKSFTLTQVSDATDLTELHALDPLSATPAAEGKWTDLLLPAQSREAFHDLVSEKLVRLGEYGNPELGTVTGSNQFFTLTDATKRKYRIPDRYLQPISPPGTKHFNGLTFTKGDWEELRCTNQRVWMLYPKLAGSDRLPALLQRYVDEGKAAGVDKAYKCSVRSPWWCPPAVSPPDLYFTYMSHRYPRLIANKANTGFVNSMHGIRLRDGISKTAKAALPLIALNSASLLGAEVFGRAYGGGVLKMEPREAAALPVPGPDDLEAAWKLLKPRQTSLDRALARGDWRDVIASVDEVVLGKVLGLTKAEIQSLADATSLLRRRRTGEVA